MHRVLLLAAFFLAACSISPKPLSLPSDMSLQTSNLPPVYNPDNGDGTYKNPIIFADYSDPDVIRVNNDFFLTASSFSCFPGLPILHSTDLVNWTIIGHAVQKYPFDNFNSPQHGNGIWAPSIRYHNHTFYIFFGDPDNGLFQTHARNAAGPWSPLHCVKQAKGWIDCCPFWDDDGKAYLVHAYARSRAGINNRLDICPMAPDGSHLLDEGTIVFNGNTDPTTTASAPASRPVGTPINGRYTTVEGPKLYKRNGYYYILAPGGGVVGGYQIAFRSKNILGPYDSKVILEQGTTPINGPHQGAWVDTQTGEDWFIHFQDRGPYGRITHLQPMQWTNDWPVIGDDSRNTGIGMPFATHKRPSVPESKIGNRNSKIPLAPQTSDDFSTETLGLQWQWFANYHDSWFSLTARKNFLRLQAVTLPETTPLFNRPNLLLQKLPAETFIATTALDPSGLHIGDSAGLVIVGRNTASLTLRKTAADGYQLARTNFVFNARATTPAEQPPDTDQASTPIELPSTMIYLRAHISPTPTAARATFEYSTDNSTWTPLGQPFTLAPDQWIGAKIGLFCNAPPPHPNPPITNPSAPGHADFDYFHITP